MFHLKKSLKFIRSILRELESLSFLQNYPIMTATNNTSIPIYKGHWLWKSTFELMKDPIQFYKERMAAEGDTFYVSFPGAKILMTGDPELIKHLLQTNHKNYEKDSGYDQLALFLGRGLVTSRGDFWRKQRRIAQPAFYKSTLLELYKSMQEVTADLIKELDTKRGQAIDMSQVMMAVTAKVAMKTLFSKDLEGDLSGIYESISYAQEYVMGRFFNPLSIPLTYINGKNRRFKKHKAYIDTLIDGLIEERIASKETYPDLLQMLLDARYEDTGEPMPRRLLIDELVTIFSAGHETSSNGLTWTLYLLSQHPDILAKLKQEINSVIGEGMPAFEDLRQLTYTKQVLEESMRLFPPVWAVGRYAKEEDTWQGQTIKKNTVTASLIYLLHHNPKIWEDPETFNPDRFTPERVKARPKHHYQPFLSGPRMCIGNHFAMMEMQLILPMLLKNFDFELVKNQRIELEPLVTLRPKYGMKMKVK